MCGVHVDRGIEYLPSWFSVLQHGSVLNHPLFRTHPFVLKGGSLGPSIASSLSANCAVKHRGRQSFTSITYNNSVCEYGLYTYSSFTQDYN